jgi:hypothetical protein
MYSQSKKDELKTNITVAYYNAYFQRSKSMPKLQKILNDMDKKEMTDDDLFNVVKSLHSQYGGE